MDSAIFTKNILYCIIYIYNKSVQIRRVNICSVEQREEIMTLHQEKTEDTFWILIKRDRCNTRYFSRETAKKGKYASSVHYADHYSSEEEAVANMPKDSEGWEALHVTWLKVQKARNETV